MIGNKGILIKVCKEKNTILVYKFSPITKSWEIIGNAENSFRRTKFFSEANLEIDRTGLMFLFISNILNKRHNLGIGALEEIIEKIESNGIYLKENPIYFLYYSDNKIVDLNSTYDKNVIEQYPEAIFNNEYNRFTNLESILSGKIEIIKGNISSLLDQYLRSEQIGNVKLEFFVKKPFSPFIIRRKTYFCLGMWSEPFILREKYHYPPIPFCVKVHKDSIENGIYVVPSIAHPHVDGSRMFGWYCGGSHLSKWVNNTISSSNAILKSDKDVVKKCSLIASYLVELFEKVNESLVSGGEADKGYYGKQDIDKMIASGKYTVVPEVM